MEKVKTIILRKPQIFLLLTVFYILVLGILKWQLKPPWETLLYFLGGILGVYFMDIAEMIFDVKPSPFHSIVFVGLLTIVSFFVVTSSGNMLAIGLVLSLLFNMLLLLWFDWNSHKNLSSWYQVVDIVPSPRLQWWGMVLFGLLIVYMSIIFI